LNTEKKFTNNCRENGAEVIKHEKNYGYGAAPITLFDKAREKMQIS